MRKIILSIVLVSVTIFTMTELEITPGYIYAQVVSIIKNKVDTSYIKTKYLNVPYANKSKKQKLDIYIPNKGKGPFPTIICIHGGAYRFGDKTDNELKFFLKGLDRGYAIVSINYRLSNESKWPTQINDVKAAIKYIRADADKYNLNPDKIALWGASAGGHLAALAGTTIDNKDFEDRTLGNEQISSKVSAVVDWYGPINFTSMDSERKKIGIKGTIHNTDKGYESQLIGGNITKLTKIVATTNPTNYITKNTPPFLIQHGNKDATVPYLQSKNFYEKLIKAIGKNKVQYNQLSGLKHADVKFNKDNNIKIVLNFLDKYLK